MQDISHQRYVLTDESKKYLEAGSPEAQLFKAIPAEGITLAALKVGKAELLGVEPFDFSQMGHSTRSFGDTGCLKLFTCTMQICRAEE